MKQEHLLLEQLTLAEEILDRGAGEGRGVRLAALVLRMHERLSSGRELPLSWRPPGPSVPPPSAAPSATLEELMRSVDEAWDDDGSVWLGDGDYEVVG